MQRFLSAQAVAVQAVVVRVLLIGALLIGGLAVGACALPAQTPWIPAGFAAPEVLSETTLPQSVRAVAAAGDGYLLALGRRLELRRPGAAPRPLLQLHPGQAFAFVATAAGAAFVGELTSGRVTRLDLVTGAVTGAFPGPANAFCAVPLASGDLLVSANPTWPAPGANSGIWLAGPARTPRELVAMSGPSGPIVLAGNGDLIAAELGPIVPPPPGSAQLLRFSSSLLQQAIAGATFTTAQASASANGYTGIYDLALDDLGRIHASDPASGVVTHTAPGGLAPNGTTIDVGAGRFALWLTFVDHAAPFRGYQPGQHAPALLVSHSDFASHFATSRMMPERPRLSCANGSAIPPGPVALAIDGSPRLGLAAILGTTHPTIPEYVITTVEGVPLWLGLAASTAVPVALVAVDAQGTASATLTNPGGYALDLFFQSVAIGQPGVAEVGSSPVLSVQLLP